MAIRTTSADVALIIEVETSISLDPFIEVASALVDELLVTTPVTYDDTRLELIERWLSAHFYAIRDLRRSQERAGSVGELFQFRLGLNLAVTMYGQQVMLIDTAGILAALSKRAEEGQKASAGITWLGTEPTSSQ